MFQNRRIIDTRRQKLVVSQELPGVANERNAVVEGHLSVFNVFEAASYDHRLLVEQILSLKCLDYVSVVVLVLSGSDGGVLGAASLATSSDFHEVELQRTDYLAGAGYVHGMAFDEVVALELDANRDVHGSDCFQHVSQQLEVSGSVLVGSLIINIIYTLLNPRYILSLQNSFDSQQYCVISKFNVNEIQQLYII
ncbi:Hypothetical_protein [Hexamita inflata]|uniref:Hypothetical_protein n=1 Tax=Hexamita inflata TaxID=28002 RepID=A0AA86RPT8_9EUKA|nr:Hypothetical protein HINF_LOCUS63489 [Hexamita inflata]